MNVRGLSTKSSTSERVKSAAAEITAVLDKYNVVLGIDPGTYGVPFVYVLTQEAADGDEPRLH